MDGAEWKGSVYGLYTSQIRHVLINVDFFVTSTGFGCPTQFLRMSRRGNPYTVVCLHKASKMAAVIRLHRLVNSRTSVSLHGHVWSRFLVSLHFMKSAELVDGDLVNCAPSFPCPHPDLKTILRVADFPCSCAVLYPEHPLLQAHVRLVVAADRHLRMC